MKATVTTNLPVIVARLGKLPRAARVAAGRALRAGLNEVKGTAQRRFLSGPRPSKLGAISGQLRRSITSKVTSDAREITGKVGSNLPYSARHEFGFKGEEKVKAHTRILGASLGGKKLNLRKLRIGVRDLRWVSSDGGRWVKDKNSPIVGYKRSTRAVIAAARAAAGGSKAKGALRLSTQQVKSHTRQVEYRGRPYLRPALNETFQRIYVLVQTAVEKAVKAG